MFCGESRLVGVLITPLGSLYTTQDWFSCISTSYSGRNTVHTQMSCCTKRHCVNITYWHFKPSLHILVLSVVSSAVPRLEGAMWIWRKPHSQPSKKGLETVWVVSSTWISCLA